ncbi:MAG: formyltransferase family protein [Hyphomicrobiales bacterium]|nr:formyltransferase family protein [Hyphomicrobiales bacterium]
MKPKSSRRAIFVATECFLRARVMRGWLAQGHEVAELWIGNSAAKPFLRRGRPWTLAFPDWSTACIVRRNGINVLRNDRLSSWTGAIERAEELGADTLITAMTYQIVPARLLGFFGRNAFNFHPALQPFYKGPHPRLGMLLHGKQDEYGGMTLHILSEGIDEGDIVARRRLLFSLAGSYVRWEALLAEVAADMVGNELAAFFVGRLNAAPQDPEAGSYIRIGKDEIMVSRDSTVDQVRRLCDVLGPQRSLQIRPDELPPQQGVLQVYRFVGVVGPPSGEPPRIARGFVEIDLSDGRVRLSRRRRVNKLGYRLARIAAMMAAPSAYRRMRQDLFLEA